VADTSWQQRALSDTAPTDNVLTLKVGDTAWTSKALSAVADTDYLLEQGGPMGWSRQLKSSIVAEGRILAYTP